MKRTAEAAFAANEGETGPSSGLPQLIAVPNTSEPHAARPQNARKISRKGSKGSSTLRRGPNFLETARQQKAATAANLILKRTLSIPRPSQRVGLSAPNSRAGPSSAQQNQSVVATPPAVSKAQRRSNVIQRAKPFILVDESEEDQLVLPSPSKRQKLDDENDDETLCDISNEILIPSDVLEQPKDAQARATTFSQTLLQAGYRFISSLGFSGWISSPAQDIPSLEINTEANLPHLIQPDEDVEMDEPETPVAEEVPVVELDHKMGDSISSCALGRALTMNPQSSSSATWNAPICNAQSGTLFASVMNNPQPVPYAPSNHRIHHILNAQPNASNFAAPHPQPSSSAHWNLLTNHIRIPTFRPTSLLPFYDLEHWHNLDRYPDLVNNVLSAKASRPRNKWVTYVRSGFKPSENPHCHLVRLVARSPLSSEIIPDGECASSSQLTSQSSLGSSASTISIESEEEIVRVPAPRRAHELRVKPNTKVPHDTDQKIRKAVLSGEATSTRDRHPYYPAFTGKCPGKEHSDILRRATLMTNFGYWLAQEGLWDFMQGMRLKTAVQWWQNPEAFGHPISMFPATGKSVIQAKPKVRVSMGTAPSLKRPNSME